MKIFITAPFKEGENKSKIENLCNLVKEAGFDDFCFIRDVENYQKMFHNPQELMSRAKAEVLNCDALLIDLSSSSTGRALEAGIAFGAGKKIIIIINKGVQLRDTAKGVADKIIEYVELTDIVQPLKEFLREVES